MGKPLTIAVILVALVGAALAGCSGEEAPERDVAAELDGVSVIQPGAPGEANRTLSPEDVAELEALGYTEADVDFARGMLAHHAQALVMTGYVEDRTDTTAITTLAARMEAAQEDEIAQLEGWLRSRDELIRDPHGHDHGHGDGDDAMAGMLTDDDIAQLEAAEGEEFDKLFLTLMITHHDGAVGMVRELYESGGGLETEIDQIARHIESDQTIEISRMQDMLEE